tara:strand:+ start:677 stop:1339 length:663 start_codon:yes stop_codon:yes gene_type:complete
MLAHLRSDLRRVLSLVLLVCSPISALRPPPARQAAPPLRHSRRAALQQALFLPIALVPLSAHAGQQCTCVTPDSCVCNGVDDGQTAIGEFERKQQREVNKIKMGGLQTSQTSTFSNYEYALPPPPPPPGAKGKAGAKGDKLAERKARDEAKDLVAVKGLASQDFDTDKSEAKRKFAAIVQQKVAEREAKLGFELDADDIKDLEKPLRIKYCGPSGLIGPC